MRKHLLPLCILILLTFLTHPQWFFHNSILTSGDWLYDFPERIREMFAPPLLWQSSYGFGSKDISVVFWPFLFVGGLLAQLGLDTPIISRLIFFWPIALLPVVTMYTLAWYILKSRIGAFLAAIVYAFNAAFLVGQTGILTVSLSAGLTPLLLWIYIKTLQEKRLILSLWTGIIAFILGFYEFRVLYMFVILLGIYTLYHFLLLEPVRQRRKNILICVGLITVMSVQIVLLNTYWLFGLSSAGAVTTNEIFARTLIGEQFVNIARTLTFFPYLWTGGFFYAFVIQPIQPQFFLIPIFAFSGLFLARKNKYLLYFAIVSLLGVFLSKQSGEPLSQIYKWLYEHVPGFNAFRESTKFYVYIGIGYSVLIGAFGVVVYGWRKNRVLRILSSCIISGIIVMFLWNAKPLITGEIGTVFVPRTIPDEYVRLKHVLQNDTTFSRVLTVPYLHRFVFYNLLHPRVNYSGMPDSFFTLNPKLLRLGSISYLILPSDVKHEIFPYFSPEKAFDRFITSALQGSSFKKQSIDTLTLWKDTKAPLPRIMPLEELVYLIGNASLDTIVDIPTKEKVGYYKEQRLPQDPKEVEPVLQRNKHMYDSATKIYSIASCIQCDPGKQFSDYVTYNYARILPDSPIYSFITWKEEKTIASSVSLPDKILKQVELAEKRIVESEALIKSRALESVINTTLLRHQQLVSQINHEITTNTFTLSDNDFLLKSYNTALLQRKLLTDMLRDASTGQLPELDDYPVTGSMLEQSVVSLDGLIATLRKQIWVSEGSVQRLALTIPQDGDYTLFVKKDFELDTKKHTLQISGKEKQFLTDANGYLSYGNIHFTKGVHPLEYQLHEENLLATASSTIQVSSSPERVKTITIPIKSFADPKAGYQLSFDYQVVQGDASRVFIEDDAQNIDVLTNKHNRIFDMRLRDQREGKWHTVSKVISPRQGVSKSNLVFRISAQDSGKASVVEIKNLSLVKIKEPVIIAVRSTGKIYEIPFASFHHENPVEYTVQVKNAKKPYLLSFAEGFDEGWEAYITPSGQKKISLFSLPQDKKVPDFHHGKINDVGNVWYIDKTGDKAIHLVYTTQKLVYIGLAISLVALAGSIIAIVVLTVKKRKHIL